MNLSFNYYHKLDDVEFYLCNPDGRELFPIAAKDRTVTLRFNDLSVIEFTLPAKLEKSDGTVIEKVEYYDYVETMRLIFATKIGWFKIVNVTENDDGVTKSKSVTAESLQTTFKDRGFLSEERVYKFYNPDDPTDSTYDASDDGAIPSVVGQLATQLGIRLDLNQGLDEPEQPYDEWTITYINEHLYYTGAGSTCRTFTEGVTYGYDWMVNDVEDAFEVIFVFDFMNRAIQIKAVSEVATRSNLCFSFSNFMNSVEVVEDASNITTVLSCSGNGVDITGVNPTGTNYIVDFSYYMDKVKHRWMSDALIAKLEAWKTEVEANKENYTKLVSQLRSQYASRTSSNTTLTMISTELQDLKNARDKYITAEATNSSLAGVVAAEAVEIGETSDDTTSDYNTSAFSATSQIEAHSTLPHFDTGTNKWTFTDAGITDTATNCFNLGYYYFIDSDDQSSYCRLTGKASIDPESNTATYSCGGFTRYVEYAKVNAWIKIKEAQVASVNSSINSSNASIASTTAQLNAISSKLNLLKYLSSTPALLRELNCYWIEGEYVNENIAVLDNTTPEEEIDLANELLETGEMELSKVCQPRLSFTLEASNALTRYEFKSQMREIELGKIITVEKEEGLWYYPALLEMTFSLDDVEDFDMVFANAFRLDDWGYTYADLISDASETSRQISANWQDLMKYSKERAEVSDLIKNPLDTTLRAAFANMVNQEFITDDTGILGRKFKFEGSEEFEDEQIRIINNVILFTDDGWETIKTALGKIYYTDSEGNNRTEYGLIGETIIGRLLMGETLEILNKNSTVKIDGSGILIKKPIYAEDGTLTEYKTMFEANADTGKLYVLEAEITGNIKGGTIDIGGNFFVDSGGNVIAKYINSKGGWVGGWSIGEGGLSKTFSVNETGETYLVGLYTGLYNNSIADSTSLYIEKKANNTTEAMFYIRPNGYMFSKYGNIGGWDIGDSSISKVAYMNGQNYTVMINSNLYTETNGIPYNPVFAVYNQSNDTWPFFVRSNGSLYASAAEITGTISGSVISGSVISGSDIKSTGTVVGRTGGARLYNGSLLLFSQYGNVDNAIECGTIISDGMIHFAGSGNMSFGIYVRDDGTIAMGGTWVNEDGDSVRYSDANLKNSIERLDDRYDVVFDNLISKRFKYNNGHSGRYHTGYVTQDVQAALKSGGVDEKEFGAICTFRRGTEREWSGLRYSEFIALNTWQIQKLKQRVSELETLIAQLTNKE